MTDKIVSGVAKAISSEFGEGCTIYSEAMPQGIVTPCFFVLCVCSRSNLFFGEKYKNNNSLCVQYLAADNSRNDCYDVSRRLSDCLEYIETGDGLLRGTNIHSEISHGVLNFFVDYNFLGTKKSVPEPVMHDITMVTKSGG